MRRIKNGADIMRRFMREFLPARTRDMHISRFIYDFITQKCFIHVAVWVFCVCVCVILTAVPKFMTGTPMRLSIWTTVGLSKDD